VGGPAGTLSAALGPFVSWRGCIGCVGRSAACFVLFCCYLFAGAFHNEVLCEILLVFFLNGSLTDRAFRYKDMLLYHSCLILGSPPSE
jgi:hypothetical protein